MTSRNYCFTCYEVDECNKMINNFGSLIKYMCIGEEICPKTKKIHYQGYMELNKPSRISGLKKIFKTTHFECRKGTQQQAIDYCSKDGKFRAWGAPAIQGKRSDIDNLWSDIKNGRDLKYIADNHPILFLKYYKAIEKYISMCSPTRNWFTELHIHYGIAGSGKTTEILEKYPNCYKWNPGNNNWWDGYNGEEDVLIDDFCGNMKFLDFLQIINKTCHKVEIKGGYVPFLAKRVHITSNFHPKDWWDWKKCNVTAFLRRITSIKEYNVMHESVEKLFVTKSLGNTDQRLENKQINITDFINSVINNLNYVNSNMINHTHYCQCKQCVKQQAA